MIKPPLFPVFIKLQGRECVVVGGNAVAEEKIKDLLDTGANVTVISPMTTPSITAWSQEGRICWLQREFLPGDLKYAFLAVVAAEASANAMVALEAERLGILCNAVDDPGHCNFYYPAVVRRGALQIAISTSGCSPALAQRLRSQLERQFGPEYEAWVSELGATRQRMFADTALSPETRRSRLHECATAEAFRSFADKNARTVNE